MFNFSHKKNMEFRRYLFDYRHDGSEWGIEIIARSPEEAKERIKSLIWAHYKGEIQAKIPASPKGIFRKISYWFL